MMVLNAKQMQTVIRLVRKQQAMVHTDANVSQVQNVANKQYSGIWGMKQTKKTNSRYVQMIKIQKDVKDRIDSGQYTSNVVDKLYELIQEETSRYTSKL